MTNEEIQSCIQPSQKRYVKINILDSSDNIVDELSGLCIDGSYTIDSNSAIRRTCDVKFVLNSKLVISKSSPLWINKRFQLYVGNYNIATDNIVYHNLGIYLINDPVQDIQINNQTISIKGLDKMCYLDGTISGSLSAKTTKISSGTPISTAIKATVKDLGHESKYIIETSEYDTPYDIEFSFGDTVYSLLKELADLYMNWKIYYDVNGYFRFKEVEEYLSSTVVFDFASYEGIVQSISHNIQYSNVKNYIKVLGKLLDNGNQYSYELNVTDSNYPSCPFTIEKMGELYPRKLTIQEDKYYTVKQCQSKAQYEMTLHNNLAETITLTTIPLFFLDVDMVVNLDYPDYNISGSYYITSISCGFSNNSLMTINFAKIYN